jgi:hypothetical protein
MDDIQRAEPGVRRVAVAIVGTTAIVGSFLIKVAPRYEPEFERWIRQAPTTRLVLAGLVLTALTTGPLLGLAAYLWALGRRTIRAGRYPPPGYRLMRDTRGLTGRPAAERGRLIEWLGAAMCVVALALAFSLWRVGFLLAGALITR